MAPLSDGKLAPFQGAFCPKAASAVRSLAPTPWRPGLTAPTPALAPQLPRFWIMFCSISSSSCSLKQGRHGGEGSLPSRGGCRLSDSHPSAEPSDIYVSCSPTCLPSGCRPASVT